MKQFVMNVEPQLIKEVDELVGKEGLYSSRNEFVRDALRSKVMEYRKLRLRKMVKEAAANAIAKGWNGEMPTAEERDKLLEEFLKKKGR